MSHPTPDHQRTTPAFTLVEVLMVVVIIGIAAALVVPSMLSSRGMVAQAGTRAIVADLTTAQSEAIARQAPIYAVFEPAGNRYKLTDARGQIISEQWGSNQTRSWIDFDENPRFRGVDLVSASFPGGSTPDGIEAPAEQVVQFDDLGSPDTGGSVVLEYDQHRYRVDLAGFTGRITVRNGQD